MRRKRTILLVLLVVTVLTTGWFMVSTVYGSEKFIRVNPDAGQGRDNVVLFSNNEGHPAKSLLDVTVKSISGNKGVDAINSKTSNRNNGPRSGENKVVDKAKPGVKDIDIDADRGNDIFSNEKQENPVKNSDVKQDQKEKGNNVETVPDNDYNEEDGLVDVMQFENKEWGTDDKVCLQGKEKLEKTQMHTPNGDVTIYVHDPDNDASISGSLVENGEWEPHLVKLVYTLLQKDPGLQFIDLGANIGVFSLAVAKLGRQVISVEPLGLNLKRLCKSVYENEFEDFITILHNAISDTHEKVTLGKEQGNIGGTFVNKNKNRNKIQGSSVIGEFTDKVNTATLDDLLTLPDFNNFRKVILKMDVEGYESHILNGAERFFRTVDVQGILMEWTWHKTGKDSNEIINFFANHGYEPVNPNGYKVLDIRSSNSWPVDILWQRRNDGGHKHEHGDGNKKHELATRRPNVESPGVKMYRHDMTKWNFDDSMCRAASNLQDAIMHTPAGDVKIFVHDPSVDVHVSGGLVRNGAWEPHLIQLMFSLLEQDHTSQFIDLGANLGVFSLAVARYGRKVVAVEPLSINLQRLCRSIKDNHFEDKITVVTNALGDKRENVSFGMDIGNVGGTFVLSEKNMEKKTGSAVGGTYKDRVLTAKVDDILNLPGFDFKKVVIKMDVEGYEHFALRGANEFFSKVDVQAVLMEWMWHKAGSGAEEIFKFYLDRGYEPYDPQRQVVLKTEMSEIWPVDVLWRKKPAQQVNPPSKQIQKQQAPAVQTNSAVQMYRRDMRQWVKDTSMCIGPANLLKANMHTNVGDVTIFVHDPSVDVHVSGSLMRGGSWEPHLIQLMYRLLNADPNLQFIDLGANLGVFSLAVAAFGRQVVAVEPLSINLHRFCASITANRFEKKITVVTNALSDKRENVTFGKDQGNVGGTFVLNDKNMNKFSGSPVNGKYDDLVLSAKLDDVLDLPGFNFKRAIMKMDVEGYEHHVLRGAHNFFRTVDVQAVLMEWMWQKEGSSASEIINFFTKYNYEPFSPGSNSMLDTSFSSNWPVDVLWQKKKSSNPDKQAVEKERVERQTSRQNVQQRNERNDKRGDVHVPEHNANARESSNYRQNSRQDVERNKQNDRASNTNTRQNSQQDVDRRAQTDRVRLTNTKQTEMKTRERYGVHFYRNDGRSWLADESSCAASQNFDKANLHTPAGDVAIFVHNPSDDVHVSGGLLRNEAWEPHLIHLMFDLLGRDQNLQFIDLGANLGVFSLAVAKFGRRVIAGEPLSINLQRFCKSIVTNHFEDKITVVTNALSDKIENVSFGKDHGNIGGTFVLNNKNTEKYSGSAVGGKFDDVVLTTKLDNFLTLPGFDFKKVIMKIDVEGYESHVFSAADKFFDQVDVQAVLMEWMWHKGGSDSSVLFNFFQKRNYEPINPGTNTRLNVRDYNVWPVDVLWKKTKNTAKTQISSSLPSMFKSGVQVYRHDLRRWQADDGVCMNLPPMTKGQITNPITGSFTIYVYDPSVDQYVSGGIIRDGGWETHLVNTVISLLKQDEDLQFVDLGANLGVYALAVAKMGRDVIAVDPLSSNVQRLCHSIQDNQLGSKLTLIYNALSDKRGHVSLGKDQRNIGGTFVVERGNENKVQGSNVNGKFSEDVVTAKLDDLLQLPGFNLKKIIMKMDVEGYEGYVLKGGKMFFEIVDVQAVFMEWMWLKSGSVTKEVIEFFTSRGYKPYVSTSGRELQLQDATNWPVDMMWKKS